MFNVEEELKKLPRKPGVYIMRDDKDVILYVGKAINLHNRVRSYFRENIGRGPAIDQMVALIARFEYIVTDSELEALVLENNLIKENSPKYNTLLKDDKTYPYIKVTVGEDYPRILFSRTMKKDKSRYFGPYTSAAAVKDTIELLNKLYQLRTCTRELPRDIGIERPCLNYHIKQCLAPCQGYVSKEEYRQQVAGALEFLNGNYSQILKDLEAMIRMLTKRGLRASDLVCSPDVADTIINDAAVQKLLDNRRIEIGNVEPELLPDGAAIVARLNVLGRIISVISYDLTYTDDEGNDKLYIPSGKCVLTAPGAGRTAYGAVSQVEQSDGEFHTYAGRRVPKYVSSAEGNSRTLTISSRPLMIPNNKNPFIVADVLTD